MLTAILIDDEQSSLNSLRQKIIQHCPQVTILAACDDSVKAIEIVEELRPDLIFLDIEMPVINGFNLLQQVSYKNFELIFTTAYDHYAVRAIRCSALDYLVKPIEIDELKSAVERAEEKHSGQTPNRQLDVLLENLAQKNSHVRRIAVSTAEGLQFVKQEDILYLEASANYTHIFLVDKKRLLVSRTLKTFEDMLPADSFIRIHHSYIINKNFTEKYIRGEGGQVILTGGVVLEVAKRKKAEFLKALGL